jgi:uncharacterized repeat protein (TIGR03806 family)
MAREHIRALLLLSCTSLAGCGGAEEQRAPALDAGAGAGEDASSAALGPGPDAYETPPDTLAAWQLFEDPAAQTPGPRTVPYDVIAPLFSDYTLKRRFLYLPEGATIGYDPLERWQLPEGAILIKTFSYPHDARHPERGERLLETRLLVVTGGKIVPHTYVWNEAQTEAERKIAGKTLPAAWIDEQGAQRSNAYGVPNTNQCHDCHGKPEQTLLLGPRTRQLDRDFDYGAGPENQLDHMAALGLFDRALEPHDQRERLVDPFGDAPLVERARAYLDSNCAHCHGEGGDASASGMWLTWPDTAAGQDPTRWGVCKQPTSAAGATCGHSLDIVPGEPDASIYMCRLESREAKVQMPPVGTKLIHDEGVALLRAWIALLPGTCD